MSLIYDSTKQQHPAINEISELLRYRYLLWNLVARDIKVRYRRTWIGIVWVMLNPLLTTLVLAVVFSSAFRSQMEHYVVFLLSGLIIWTIFSEATTIAMQALISQSYLLSTIYVPPSVFVLTPILSSVFVHIFDILPLLLIAIIDHILPQASWLLIPIPMILTTVMSFGVALAMSSLVLYFSDIVNIYQLFLRIGFFMTPVFYALSSLDPRLAKFVRLNPITNLIESFRSAIMGGLTITSSDIVLSTFWAFVTLIIGWLIFTRTQRGFSYRL